MNVLRDLVLTRPAGEGLLRFLLFFVFSFHLFFVLLLLGTAIISMYYFYHTYWTKQSWELRWDKEMLRHFLLAKALAVVLGVGPLLVIQLYYSVPFYTAITMFGPIWLAVILIMIGAFIFIDGIGQKISVHPKVHLVFGSIGLLLLLAVPAVFVTILVTVERPELWKSIVRNEFQFPAEIMIHWVLRYLHVIGAAIVFGAAFQYFISIKEDHEYRRDQLIRWIVVGMLFQFLVGSLLAFSIRLRIDRVTLIPLGFGILAAVLVVWVIHLREVSHGHRHLGSLVYLLPLVLVGMLLTRQFIQQQQVLPLVRQAEANAVSYRQQLNENAPESAAIYTASLNTVYEHGEVIFERSCSFCHGLDGSGITPESARLIVPPEEIASVRADEPYLRDVLLHGVPGSAMPYFSVFLKDKVDSLISFLDESFSMTASPSSISVELSQNAVESADSYFNMTCSLCHGTDGKPTDYGLQLAPAPPDFTRYSVEPERAFTVITQGYPGTVMEPFSNLSEEMRWGLVRKVLSLRQ